MQGGEKIRTMERGGGEQQLNNRGENMVIAGKEKKMEEN
jgi:hypothetical protein